MVHLYRYGSGAHRYRCIRCDRRRDKAKAAVAAYQQIAIRLTEIDLGQALDLSYRLDIYAYDAYLIACSLQFRAPLLTVDGPLRDAARRVEVKVLEVV